MAKTEQGANIVYRRVKAPRRLRGLDVALQQMSYMTPAGLHTVQQTMPTENSLQILIHNDALFSEKIDH